MSFTPCRDEKRTERHALCPAGFISDVSLHAAMKSGLKVLQSSIFNRKSTIVSLHAAMKSGLKVAHIELVGSVDEYSGFAQADSAVRKYRDSILQGKEYTSALDAWRIVQDATLDKFRDGTMSVYGLKREDDALNASSVLNNTTCGQGTSGAFGRYVKHTCILGIVFQDDAVFVVSRKYGDSSKSLTVDLACGHVENSNSPFVVMGEKPNVRHVQVILEGGVDKVSVSVPPALSAFELRYKTPPGNYMRCEITQVSVDGVLVGAADEKDFAGFVKVSTNPDPADTTFSTLVKRVMGAYGVPTFETSGKRISLIKDAILYTYLWGHYAGFIKMPHSSIRDLISYPTYVTNKDYVLPTVQQNESDLQRYRSLGSLFSFPGDGRHDVENFGLFNPKEAQNEYGYRYYDRYDYYHAVALGNFLSQVSEAYR